MKHLLLLIFLILIAVSCQSNDYESYRMSWMGWALVAVIGLSIFLVIILKKGVVDETEGKMTATKKNDSTVDFEAMGSYLGGHPDIQNPIPGIVFRRNSNCCMFFYKNHPYDLPEFKFKIKIRSFTNISVEDTSSLKDNLLSDGNGLSDQVVALLKKKKKNQLALMKIDWMKEQSKHSAIFSFEGKDAVQKANKARENLLRALN